MRMRGLSSRPFGAVILLMTLVALLEIPAAWAQQPSYYSFNAALVDHSNQGGDLSCFDRPHTSQILYWGTSLTPYLLQDMGNDLDIYRVMSSGATLVADAGLGLGYNCSGAAMDPDQTDSKSTDRVRGASVCPGCRFGVIHVDGSDWLFDLGTGSNPTFAASQSYSGTEFGATYKVGGVQYVWGWGVNGELCGGTATSPNPGIWRVTSATSLGGPEYCFADRSYLPGGSIQLAPDLLLYYEGSPSSRGLRLATLGSGGIPQPFASTVPVGSAAHFKVSQPGGFGTYPVYVLAVDAGSAPPAKVYRIDSATSGFVDTGLNISGASWGTGAITVDASGAGFVFLAETTTASAARRGLFQVSGLAGGAAPMAQEVDFDYWNSETSDFNATLAGSTTNLVESNAIFYPGGGWLYFSRFRALDEFKYSPQAPQPPVASGSVTVSTGQGDAQGDPFPGDTVIIANTTTSTYDQSAIWVTDGSGQIPAGGGSDQLSPTTPAQRTFQIPADLAAGETYTAHVKVLDSVNFPGAPDEWTQQIAIDRRPSAVITVSPPAVLTGETVNLAAVAEGTPISGGSAPAYHWAVGVPGGATCPSPFADDGNGGCAYDEDNGQVDGVVLDFSGTYTFDLAVDYAHEASQGVLYQAHAAPVQATAAWGAPVLSGVSPPNPTMDDQVTLHATGSRLSDGQSATYRYVLDGNDVGSCTGSITGGTGGTVTVPDCAVGTLSPGTHTAQVVFTAPGDVLPTEVPSQPYTFDVADTSMDFTWELYQDNDSDGQMDVGDVVRFTKTSGSNVTAWDFGAADCDGNSPQVSCTVFPCNSFDWTYGSSGTFPVRMTTADGSVTHTVAINPGQCAQTCSYSVSPTSISVSSGSTSRTISISTGSGCTWSASESLSWLSLNQTSGSGSATLTVTIQENTSSSQRSGQITISGQNGFTRTVSITQSGTGGGGGGGGGGGSPAFSYQLSVDRDSNGQINVGDTVAFTSTGGGTVTGWNFGAADCDGTSPAVSCAVAPCPSLEWTYGTAGTFTVTMSTTSGDAAQSVTVGTGSCPSGSCSYTLSPSFVNMGASGGSGSFNVSTGSSCSWSATAQETWVHVNKGSGTGSGTVSYTVDANSGSSSRTGHISVADRTFVINQSAGSGGGGGGGGTETGPLLVPAAASIQGLEGTFWKSDLRIFNPSDRQVTITIQFLPEPGDTTPYPDLTYHVDPDETIWIDDIMRVFLQGASAKGALVITYDPEDGPRPLVASRTYNQTDTGTYGQFIPVLSSSSLVGAGGRLIVPGVEHSDLYRTNVGLVNSGTEGAGVTVTLIDDRGNQVVHASLGVPARNYMQLSLDAIAANDPDAGDVSNFKGTVVMDVTNGGPVAAYGSVVDQRTGDPIFIEAVRQ